VLLLVVHLFWECKSLKFSLISLRYKASLYGSHNNYWLLPMLNLSLTELLMCRVFLTVLSFHSVILLKLYFTELDASGKWVYMSHQGGGYISLKGFIMILVALSHRRIKK
jgi:hypothetical protein